MCTVHDSHTANGHDAQGLVLWWRDGRQVEVLLGEPWLRGFAVVEKFRKKKSGAGEVWVWSEGGVVWR